jgi:hypothetical protein
MPVLLVAAPPHPDAPALVAGVADAVAHALGLGDGDVIAAHVPTGVQAVSGGASTAPWATVTIHGGDRGAESVLLARAAAEGAVLAWAELIGAGPNAPRPVLGGVWVSWVPSTP